METLSVKIPSEMREQIESYATEIGETRSVATRKLIREGLKSRESPNSVPTHVMLAWVGSVVAAAALINPAGRTGQLAGLLGFLVFLSGLIYPHALRRLAKHRN